MSTVTFVRQGPFLLAQFNTTCDESIPICDAMCCRMRRWFNINIDLDEAPKYLTQVVDGALVLKASPNGDCVYLKDARCSIYADRPRQCRKWHCSPLGNKDNPEISDRANGWLLMIGNNEVLNRLAKQQEELK